MIELRKMTEVEFGQYFEKAFPNYVEEKMKGEGLKREEATKVAQDSFDSLLPDGIYSKNQFLFSVVEGAEKNVIGHFWFARKDQGQKPYAFIYDIALAPEARGKGLGKRLMELAEAEVSKIGLNSMGLHVFGHNETAIALYEKSGFRTTNRIMVKDF